jgi:hypothetical protein
MRERKDADVSDVRCNGAETAYHDGQTDETDVGATSCQRHGPMLDLGEPVVHDVLNIGGCAGRSRCPGVPLLLEPDVLCTAKLRTTHSSEPDILLGWCWFTEGVGGRLGSDMQEKKKGGTGWNVGDIEVPTR